MNAVRPSLLPRYAILAAALFAGGCGTSPFGKVTTGPAAGGSAAPDLLARPAGFRLHDYHVDEGRPEFGVGGTISGKVKTILRWPPYHDLQMVHKGEYDRLRIGMT